MGYRTIYNARMKEQERTNKELKKVDTTKQLTEQEVKRVRQLIKELELINILEKIITDNNNDKTNQQG